MTSILKTHSDWNFYNSLRICGEITTSDDLCHFGLNCKFCSIIFLLLDDFIEHILAKHVDAIEILYAEQEEFKNDFLISENSNIQFDNKDGDIDSSNNCQQQQNEQQPTSLMTSIDFESEDETGSLETLTTTAKAKNAKVPYELQMKLAVIYEQHPILWNSYLENETMKPIEMDLMLQQVNTELNLQLNTIQLKNRLVRLRKLFRNEKQKSILCSENNYPFKPNQPELFGLLSYLDEHIGPFQCSDCNEVFVLPKTYRSHLNDHKGKSRYICNICQQDLQTICRLRRHKQRHTNKTSNACRYCKRKFAKNYDLSQHELTHGTTKNYKCHACDQTFTNSANLRTHRHRHHRELLTSIKEKFQCMECFKIINDLVAYEKHMHVHLMERKYVCGICGKRFKERRILKQHEEVHCAKKTYKCQHCKKTFFHNFRLTEHEKKVHSNLEIELKDLDLDLDLDSTLFQTEVDLNMDESLSTAVLVSL